MTGLQAEPPIKAGEKLMKEGIPEFIVNGKPQPAEVFISELEKLIVSADPLPAKQKTLIGMLIALILDNEVEKVETLKSLGGRSGEWFKFGNFHQKRHRRAFRGLLRSCEAEYESACQHVSQGRSATSNSGHPEQSHNYRICTEIYRHTFPAVATPVARRNLVEGNCQQHHFDVWYGFMALCPRPRLLAISFLRPRVRQLQTRFRRWKILHEGHSVQDRRQRRIDTS